MRLITLFVCIFPFAAQAAPILPDTLLKAIKADPASYLDQVAGLIAAYGTGDGITAEQVDASVALQRAKARTAAMIPLLAADLNGDGAVTRDEILVAEAAASATARGKMEKAFVAADADGDLTVTAEELAEFGAAAAMAAVSPAKLAQTKVLMGFDADGDGRVTLAEVRAGLAGLMS